MYNRHEERSEMRVPKEMLLEGEKLHQGAKNNLGVKTPKEKKLNATNTTTADLLSKLRTSIYANLSSTKT